MISLPVQQWLSRNVQPGQSIICQVSGAIEHWEWAPSADSSQLFFDGRIGWHHAQGSQHEV